MSLVADDKATELLPTPLPSVDGAWARPASWRVLHLSLPLLTAGAGMALFASYTARNGLHGAPDATTAGIFVAIFAGSLVAGLAGFAFSAVAGALLLHWVSPAVVVPLLVACSITTQLISITKLWRTMAWRQCAPFLLGGLVGIPLGAELLADVNPAAFGTGVGVMLVCYSIYMLVKPGISIGRGGRYIAVAAGFAGGVAIAFPGAFPTILCSLRNLSKETQRGIVQPYILVMQIATLAYFSRLGFITSATATTYLWCLPAVLGGTWLGLRLFNRVDDALFRKLVLVFLLVSGATMVL
jgi:uncharacterized membrane protein YfcA